LRTIPSSLLDSLEGLFSSSVTTPRHTSDVVLVIAQIDDQRAFGDARTATRRVPSPRQPAGYDSTSLRLADPSV
jgi:hypothetical protein